MKGGDGNVTAPLRLYDSKGSPVNHQQQGPDLHRSALQMYVHYTVFSPQIPPYSADSTSQTFTVANIFFLACPKMHLVQQLAHGQAFTM